MKLEFEYPIEYLKMGFGVGINDKFKLNLYAKSK